MKKIFWTSVFWIVAVIVFWAYVRLFNPALGEKLSYCFIGDSEAEIQTGIQKETVDYSQDILMINAQLSDIKNKVDAILQNLGTNTNVSDVPVAPTNLPVAPSATTPYNGN